MFLANVQMGTFNLERNGFFLFDARSNPTFVNGFSVSPKPGFGIALNANRARRIQIFNVRAPNCRIVCALSRTESEKCTISGGFLEKEFKFEPAFDEYLKVMESVTNGGVKEVSRGRDGNRSKKSLVGEDDLGGSDRNLHRVKSIDSVEQGEGRMDEKIDGRDQNTRRPDKLVENDGGGTHRVSSGGRLVYKERERDMGGEFPKKGRSVSSRDSSKGKWGYRESERDLKDDRGLRSYQKLAGVKRDGSDGDPESRKPGYFNVGYSVVRRNRKWTKDEVRSVGKKMGESGISKRVEDVRGKGHYGKFNVVKRGESNGHLREGEPGHYKDSIEMRKKQLQQDGTWAKGWIDNAEWKMDEFNINEVMPRRKSVFRTKDETKTNESNVNKGILGSESFYRSDDETDMESKINNSILGRGSFSSRMDEGKADNFVRNRYEIDSDNEENEVYADEIEINTANHGTVVPRLDPRDSGKEVRAQNRSERQVWLRKDAVEARKVGPMTNEVHVRSSGKYVQAKRNKEVFGSRRVLMEDDDRNGLVMERKAFQSFEVFTDIRNRPRVLRMEMEERIKKLAKSLNGTDVNLPEWQFSKMMHSAEIKFTDHSILRIVQILGALGNWRRALQVVEWLQSRDRFKSYKSKYIYTSVLDVLGKAKRPVEALNVFHAMRQQLSSYPDLAAYHCIAVTLGQAGYMKELFDVIDCMRTLPEKKFKMGMLEKWDPRLEPDIVIYNAVLNACVRRKQWEGAFWVLQQLKQRHMPPSSTTYGLVMEVMFACGKYSLVHEFFRKAEKTSIPNALNYKVLVNTLWREGKTDEAILVVQDMERRGIVGSASLYYDLARCLCSAGRCQEALQQVEKICKVAKKPLVVTYTGLIQACLESGSVQNGAYIFDEMHKFCSPNVVTCNIMLKAYIEHGMFEEAKDLFQKLLDGSNCLSSRADTRERVLPDNFTFNTMLEASAAEKRWDDFGSFYREMLHHGHHFNPKRHLRMILEASRAGKGQSLEATSDHLIRSGRPVPLPIIKERFCAKLQDGKVSAAISCICDHQISGPHTFSEKVWLDLFNGNADRFQEDDLVRLVHEVSTLTAENDRPNSILENLVSSCREFIRTHVKTAASGPLEIRQTPSDLEGMSY
ncbi:pentatricopeptide repeat-containing protein At1g30610, chloroplastic [Magnolia sinica]|uniref:pentatricopeptide repeat-containing protein At1g30610, chloroplastic n=1 Tax=Magnolia sinica TaxID=86752 RepID=UPI00265A9306|nr:pentatricopeptide repeat-containing protein At1g30610, chloroplastic [Magnolia sinica]